MTRLIRSSWPRCAAVLAAAVTATMWLGGACASEEPKVAQFAVRAESDLAPADLAAGFVTDQGEEVRLLDLRLSLGPVYVIEERSLYARAVHRPLVDVAARIQDWLLPPARAHGTPQEFAATTVVGESLGARVWSLRSGPIALSPGEGIEVSAGSVDVELLASPADSPLFGHAAVLTFAVARGGVTAVVRAHFDWDVRAEERTITNIPADLELQDGGTLTLSLDPTHYFDGVSFAALFDDEDAAGAGSDEDGSGGSDTMAIRPTDGREEAPFELAPDDGLEARATLHTALQRRLLSVGAWQVGFAPGAPQP